MKNIIEVTKIGKNKAILKYKDIITEAFIGKNGLSKTKVEGDKKTPVGEFKLGICFGIHNRKMLNIKNTIQYFKIDKYQYWVDDINSKYYNKNVDIRKVKKDWNSAEHLIDYKKQYEYAIEIKVNPKNISNNGSAIFIHCSINKSTAGCIAIEKEKMKELLSSIDENTKILIKNQENIL